MALIAFDSGEATRYPTYASISNISAFYTVANQPSPWQVFALGNNNLAGFQTATTYSGTTAMRVNNGWSDQRCAVRREFGVDFTESYISLMFRVDVSSTKTIVRFLSSAGTQTAQVQIDTLQRILLYAGTTLKVTTVTGWATNQWHQIRLHIDTATNTLEMILDDGSIIDGSGTVMVPWRYIHHGLSSSNETVAATTNLYIDCFQLNDATGSINNSWPDVPRILTATSPIADDASYDDWTPLSGGDEYAMIDEVSPDLDTTYVYSNATGDTSAFEFGTTTTEPADVIVVGVCLTCVAKRADAAYLTPVVIRGASYVEVTALKKAVEADYMTPMEFFMETDPITSVAWLMTDLNTTEFGFKHTTS